MPESFNSIADKSTINSHYYQNYQAPGPSAPPDYDSPPPYAKYDPAKKPHPENHLSYNVRAQVSCDRFNSFHCSQSRETHVTRLSNFNLNLCPDFKGLLDETWNKIKNIPWKKVGLGLLVLYCLVFGGSFAVVSLCSPTSLAYSVGLGLLTGCSCLLVGTFFAFILLFILWIFVSIVWEIIKSESNSNHLSSINRNNDFFSRS